MYRDTLVFGHMHEDHAAELALAGRMPSPRCLVIASGGDLALQLASAGFRVVVVDSNSAQIALVRLKMEIAREVGAETAAEWMTDGPSALLERIARSGLNPQHFANGLCFCGRVDRALRWSGPLVAWLLDWPTLAPGISRRVLEALLQRLLPVGVRLLHGPRSTSELIPNSIGLMKRRLLAAMNQAGAARNPLLMAMLGRGFGTEPPPVWRESAIRGWLANAANVELRCSTIEAALALSEPHSFGLISLSNLADLLDATKWQSLLASAATALVPGGFLVARLMLHSALPPPERAGFSDITVATLNECDDRSPLCPIVWIGQRTGSG